MALLGFRRLLSRAPSYQLVGESMRGNAAKKKNRSPRGLFSSRGGGTRRFGMDHKGSRHSIFFCILSLAAFFIASPPSPSFRAADGVSGRPAGGTARAQIGFDSSSSKTTTHRDTCLDYYCCCYSQLG